MNELLLKYNRPGPRYTSYPPANFFHQNYTAMDYKQSIIDSNDQTPENISVYIHIPFCRRLCHFCGCNTGIAKEKGHIKRYIDALIKEIKTVSLLISKTRRVTQVHWGGGTPNSIPFEYIADVMRVLRDVFKFDDNAEVAMECSPAYLSKQDITALSLMGFNRLSLGIQDFHDEILKNVNRQPSKIPYEELIRLIRNSGIKKINLDLMYGLPDQTRETFADSIKKAIELSPDRLVTFSYAHVPWFNKSMMKLEEMGLPSTEDKFALFGIGYEILTNAGYIPIGLDHYAKSQDELSIALREGKLHRNFQGYCTKETTGQVYAFGSSAISQLWNAYSQNAKDYQKYTETIENNDFAVERGYRLNRNEVVTREVINSLMCNGFVDFNEIGNYFGLSSDTVKDILKYSPENFSEFIYDGLININDQSIKVNRKGMLVIRNIVMALDPINILNREIYSKTI